jgi:hypothetical protein
MSLIYSKRFKIIIWRLLFIIFLCDCPLGIHYFTLELFPTLPLFGVTFLSLMFHSSLWYNILPPGVTFLSLVFHRISR